jgi:hypothetical protein
MKKIVINACYGGFSLSDAAILQAREWGCQWAIDNPVVGERYQDGSIKHDNMRDFNNPDVERDDEYLVRLVEEMGSKACTRYSKLRIVEIPDDVKWTIDEYDGMESVEEEHRSWR